LKNSYSLKDIDAAEPAALVDGGVSNNINEKINLLQHRTIKIHNYFYHFIDPKSP